MSRKISSGVAHELPKDLREALSSDAKALAAWEDITPLSRNEWICWYGCTHRADKALSPSQKFVLRKRTGKSA